MAKNISVGNALEVLALAERYSIEPTKSLALQFISKHFPDVSETNAWIAFNHQNHLPEKHRSNCLLKNAEYLQENFSF